MNKRKLKSEKSFVNNARSFSNITETLEDFATWEKHFDYEMDRKKEAEMLEDFLQNGAERKRQYESRLAERKKENTRRLEYCKKCFEHGQGKRTDIRKNGGCSCYMV